MLNLQPMQKPDILVTAKDKTRLLNLAFAAISTPEIVDELLNELDRAKIVSEAEAATYIRVGSTATFTTSFGEEKTVTLVFPAEADIEAGKISLLTPVGVALLGLSEGQSIDWKARDDRIGTLTIVKIC